jgi:hypothetical protein
MKEKYKKVTKKQKSGETKKYCRIVKTRFKQVTRLKFQTYSIAKKKNIPSQEFF